MTKINESDLNIEFFPCSLFYEEYANAHNLTFIKINDTSVLLFFITSDKQSVKYMKIDDDTNLLEEKDSTKKIIQLHISIDEPVEIYELNPSYVNNSKNEIFISDLIHTETKSNNETDETSNKTIIFSCGREIFSFTPMFSTFNMKLNPVLLKEKIQIHTDIQVSVQNSNQNSEIDDSNDIKTYSCNNYIVKLIPTSEPRVFAALFVDGTVVICRHPQFSDSKEKSSNSSSIETEVLFNYHRCKPILSCIADDFSFLTFDENHVAILWESFPGWWSEPYCLKMFENNNDDDDEKNDYDNNEEEKNEDIVEDHF